MIAAALQAAVRQAVAWAHTFHYEQIPQQRQPLIFATASLYAALHSAAWPL